MDFQNNQAIYIQIADIMCENILLKKWEEDERIPSIREIAVAMEVNPNTAIRTFNYLQDMGIIYNKRGIGYFIAEDGYKKTLDYKKKEFMKIDVPLLFKKLNMLNIDINDIVKLYKSYK